MYKLVRMYKFVIEGGLPGANEYINAERTNKYKAAAMKREAEAAVVWAAKRDLGGVRFETPVFMAYKWIEPGRRRDKDNIAFARKFVQDALVKCGVLKNDGWSGVSGFSDTFLTDKSRPRVEVEIWEDGTAKRSVAADER